MIVRLPSRVEYLVAVLLSSLFLGHAHCNYSWRDCPLIRGPDLTIMRILSIPPMWISINLLASILAMHATDLVTTGWSRVVMFGFWLLLSFE